MFGKNLANAVTTISLVLPLTAVHTCGTSDFVQISVKGAYKDNTLDMVKVMTGE